jgi:uncharacterized protein YndB with AHSA1/START domain
MTSGITTHTLGDTTFTLTGDRTFVATRVVDAPRSLVWEAWTSPRHVPHWVLGPAGTTMPVCEIDLRPEGKWHFKWREPNGFEMDMHGTYLEIMPPVGLVNTESWGLDWSETLNTLVLTEEDGRTMIEVSILYQSSHARERALATGMEEGWSQSFDRLEDYLRTVV